MDRTTAAARATRAAEKRGHALGEWQADDTGALTVCSACGLHAWINETWYRGERAGYRFDGGAIVHLCRPIGKSGTLTHNAED